MVAEDYGLLDQVSDGRCDMGVARGFVPHEFDTFEVDPSETAERISGVSIFVVSFGQVRPLLTKESFFSLIMSLGHRP